MSWVTPQNKDAVGLMGHVIADVPSRKEVLEKIAVMAEAGVKIIEIQIPFSEPVADGPVFLKANHRALKQNVTVQDCFDLMKIATSSFPVNFVFMTYLNIVFKMSYTRFVQAAKAAGAKGVIIPDLPMEYAQDLEAICHQENFTNIKLLSPNCSEVRMRSLCANARDLIYVVARSGVTGAGTKFGDDVDKLLHRVKTHTNLPLAVGFGIRTANDIRFLKGKAAFAVVGTRAFQVFDRSGLGGLRTFWSEICAAGQ